MRLGDLLAALGADVVPPVEDHSDTVVRRVVHDNKCRDERSLDMERLHTAMKLSPVHDRVDGTVFRTTEDNCLRYINSASDAFESNAP